MPKISVIVPVYNAARYVREAVESVLAQTFTDFELIIVNDGSTDASEKILRDLAACDHRIKLISRPNTGYIPALQEAIAASTGEFLARMDADDYCFPDRFEKQVMFLDAHPRVGVVGASYELMDGRGRKLHALHQPTDDWTLQRACLAGTTPICHPTAMIRRRAYDAAGGYSVAALPAEDLDLWLRIGEIAELACVPDVLLRYRLHPNSVSETKQAMQIESVRKIRAAAMKRRGLPADLAAEKPWREEAGAAGRLKQTLKYGWWAFNSRERSTAVAYGCAAVRQAPTLIAAWRLLGCAMLKPLPALRVVYAEVAGDGPILKITPDLTPGRGPRRPARAISRLPSRRRLAA